MSRRGTKSRKLERSRNAGPPRNQRTQLPPKDPKPTRETEHRRLPERPHRFFIGILLVLIILVGHLAAPAIADPASVPRPWSFVVAILVAATMGLSTATLTSLVYCLAFFRDVEPARNLLKWIANYAAIGAILGTLLGLRMAGPLLADAQQHPTAQHVTFVGLLGTVSNTATLFTLFMIAVCWLRIPVLIKEVAADSTSASHTSSKPLPAWTRHPKLRWLQNFSLVVVGNSAGLWASIAVWNILQHSP